MNRIVISSLVLALSVSCASGQKAGDEQTSEATQETRTAEKEPAAEPEESDHHGHRGHRFEDPEEWSKRFDDPARDEWQRPALVMQYMDIQPGMTVVDLGTGTGYFLPYISQAVGPSGAVIGLDIEPKMVEYVQQKADADGLANVSARLVKPDHPGLEPGSVDRVLIVNTWHHIKNRKDYAGKLAAAVRPDGKVFIVDYTKESESGPPTRIRLEPETVVEELQAGGFQARILEENLARQYIVVGQLP